MNTLVQIINNQAKTTSNIIADTFGKRHCDVLRAINNLEIPDDFRVRNFAHSTFKAQNRNGLSFDNYEITRDGFTLLAMGFNGKKAMQFKIVYINAFNEMEATIKQNLTVSSPSLIPDKDTMKAMGGLVKRCCSAAIREELISLFNDIRKQQQEKKSRMEEIKEILSMCKSTLPPEKALKQYTTPVLLEEIGRRTQKLA